jgi:hypothetical protein
MRQWSKHIRKGKAGHSIGITGDSLTKQHKCNMSRTLPNSLVPHLQGVLGVPEFESKLECCRQRWLRCVRSSQFLLVPATGQEDVRSWQSSWHWLRKAGAPRVPTPPLALFPEALPLVLPAPAPWAASGPTPRPRPHSAPRASTVAAQP